MPLDPGIITSAMANWQQPADPLATYAKLQALRNGIQQQQIGRQQLQSGALDIQQKQEALGAQKALDDVMKTAYTTDADGNLTLNKDAVAQHLAQTGNGHLLPSVLKNFQDMDEAATKAKTAKVALQTAQNDQVASSLSNIVDSNFDPKIAVATVAHAQATGTLPPAQAQQITAQIQQNPTPEGVKAVVTPFMAQSPAYQKLVNERATAQAATTSAGARKDQAATAGDRLSDERIERALNAAAGATNQAQLDAARNQALKSGASPAQINAIPMQFSPDAMTAYSRARLSPEQRTTADQRAAAETATEADRKVAQAQRDRENAISAGRLGLEQKRFQAETGAQGNQALVNVPLNQRNAALADAVKVGNDAAQASHAADEMNDLINLARSGNKVAYAYSPVTGVLTINSANGSKRVNLNEIEAYQGAGSALDSIKGWLGKKATGASIDDSVLNDMQQVHTKLAATAQDMYKRKLDVVNSTYKSNFAPVPFATAPAPAQTGAPAAEPAWKATARSAPIGATIPLPGGKKVLKTGENQFQPIP